MASYTFYSGTADGYITSRNADWATCQVGSSLAADTVDNADLIGHFVTGGGSSYGVNQAFLGFDTSSLPDTAEITAATLSLYLSNGYASSGGSPSIEARTYDWSTTVTTADWRTTSQWNALTRLASLPFSTGAVDAYSAFTEDGTNLRDAISKTGTTRMILCSDNWTGIAPSGLNYIVAYFADEAGTTKDPKLEVTTFEPPAFTPQVMWIN